MGGFALARLRFRGRKWVEALVLGAIVIPAPLLLAPGFQLLFHLGLLDTMAGLILPATKIYGVIERLIYDTDDTAPAAVKHYRRDAWFLEGIQRFGDAGIWVSFGQGFDGECSVVNGTACSTHALGSIMYSVGATYEFGKRTTLYASFFGVVNDDAASYGIFPSVGTTAAGADTRSFGIGILHTF